MYMHMAVFYLHIAKSVYKEKIIAKNRLRKKNKKKMIQVTNKLRWKKLEIFSDCIALLNVKGMWGVVQTYGHV